MRNRRQLLITLGAGTLKAEPPNMFGLIGKMIAKPGQRDELISILVAGTSKMPGCLSYIVAKDPTEPDALWITEVWHSEAQHKASLGLPEVRAAITKGKPLIASFAESHTTIPVGGHNRPLAN